MFYIGKRGGSIKQKLILIVIISIFIVGCTPAEESPKTSGEVIKVGKYYWPGEFWVEIANEKGWFEEAGLNVELIDTNKDYFGSLQDMVDGNIDTTLFTIFDLMEFNIRGADLVAVIVVDISAGADGLVAKSKYNNLAELKGKRIGVQDGTFTEYMLDVFLSKNNLNMQDVEIVETQPEDIQLFIDGSIEALVTWEPFASQAAEKGDGRILMDSSQVPGLISDINPFHRTFIEERPEDVQAFVQVWHRTTEFIKDNPDEAFGIIAQNYGQSLEDVKAFTEEVKVLDLRENKQAFLFSNDFESLHGTARQINNFMIKKRITDEQLDTTAFLDARFIRGVEE